ncbi:hypothetical protein G7Z17_g5405 [Cylindrodendrum hubeiense]|uniref:Cation/H+ exchanger transmembrane domain-containing protein n=1 Tax=Cylindrodendrum hubeiense TaxID=595255 RepID=A0A9P5HD12_9HYPO|nr:hypothetical protein G7Z17_g5405 [Cylindrodendrum hubeiense]
MDSSLSYHEPSVVTIAILSGFLLLLNLVNYGLDKIAFCGLIGQVVLGIAWGTPGGKLLDRGVEDAIMQLGYLGLILLVFEGGLATSFKTLKANLALSTGVAITGISVPMGFSFLLQPMVGATPLQAFAAGAALCSTSLGTTFTILSNSGLSSTRLGVVLTSAAMMDDVVGLIMVQVVSNLGGGDFTAVTVIRPVMVSLAFATLVPVLCKFLVVPITLKLNTVRESSPESKLATLLKLRQTAFIIHTALLLILVIGGTFAGTSSLLAAYIAGAAISWWDSEVAHVRVGLNAGSEMQNTEESETNDTDIPDRSTLHVAQVAPATQSGLSETHREESSTSGLETYDRYYRPVVEYVFKPFFFASIGFSVPITRMFSGPIVWRGVIYTILMTVGKLVCGAWLVPFASPLRFAIQLAKRVGIPGNNHSKPLAPGAQCANLNASTTDRSNSHRPQAGKTHEVVPMETLPDGTSRPASAEIRNSAPKPEKPRSLYPACIMGLGMVARGEIGFLVAALAESKGIFGRQSSGQPSELFLIVTWAISLCTVIGPICVGLVVNRVRRLESGSCQAGVEGSQNVLGAWGFSLEADVWYDHFPGSGLGDILAQNISVPGLSPQYPAVHCTADGNVCQVTTGMSEINAATTITALVLSSKFDLKNTYFLLAGIAGVNPKYGTLGSVALARFALQPALQYEIDPREIPEDWKTGYFSFGTKSPTEYPTEFYGTEVFELNEALRDVAFDFASTATLNDTTHTQEYRSKYEAGGSVYDAATKPPSLIKCDTSTSDVFFSGNFLGEAFEDVTSLWTNGIGKYCMSAQEDNAILEVLIRFHVHKSVDFNRVIVLRTGSNFDRPPPGIDAVTHLRGEHLNGVKIAVDNIYLAGVEILKGILGGWDETFINGVKPSNYVGDVFGTIGGVPGFKPIRDQDTSA